MIDCIIDIQHQFHGVNTIDDYNNSDDVTMMMKMIASL